MRGSIRARRAGSGVGCRTTFSDLAGVKNIRVLGYTTDALGPPFIGSAWYAHTAWISANRDVASRCRQALREAAQWANAHQSDSGPILTKYLGLTPEQVSSPKRHRPDCRES